MAVDLERPPALITEETGAPPADAWNLQIAAPPAFLAWLATRVGPDGQPDLAARVVFPVVRRRALSTVWSELPQVASDWHSHHTAPWTPLPYPHVHVFLAARDVHGHPVTRETVERVGSLAWTALLDRLVEYTSRPVILGLTWTGEGIAGVDGSWVDEDVCSEPYGPRPTVLAAS